MTAHSSRPPGRSRKLKAAAIMATAAPGLMTLSSPALAEDPTATADSVATSDLAANSSRDLPSGIDGRWQVALGRWLCSDKKRGRLSQ